MEGSDRIDERFREGRVARVGEGLYDEVPSKTNGRTEWEFSSSVVYDIDDSLKIEPFETNKTKKIKDYANQRLGKVISSKDTSKVYNRIVDYIYADFGVSVKNIKDKVHTLF